MVQESVLINEKKDSPFHILISFISLCKPRVVELLITTALPAMFLAQGGFPQLRAIFGVLVGGTLAAGSANAINSIWERDIDIKMNRTKRRPMPQRQLTVSQAWVLAGLSQILSVLIVSLSTNVVAGFFTLLATFIYVVVYTIWLKPRTDQNIVIGGAAGSLPAVIGYSAITGTAPWQAWIMFLVIFLWTPAHFWAFSIFHEEDYRRGGFPMLPITKGKAYATHAICIYSILTVIASLLLILDPRLDLIYFITSWVCGIWFIYESSILAFRHQHLYRGRYMRFFHISNGYLAMIFIAIAVDTVVN